MNINGMGSPVGMPVMNAATPKARPQAENPMAQKAAMPAMPAASQSAGGARPAVEAKGMFVDTYA